MSYKFTFKHHKKFIWQSRTVTGHKYEQAFDKMVLFFDNGGLEEIPHWKDYNLKLGTDWAIALQKHLESQAGQPIPINIKGGK